MTIQLKHATQAVGANANNGEIHKEQWNESHDLTGLAGASMQFNVSTGIVEEVVHSYAQLSDSGNQIPANTSETLVTFDTQDTLVNMGHSGGTITCHTARVYAMWFGGQIGKAAGSAERSVDLWVKHNGTNIANSGVRNALANTQTNVLIIHLIMALAVNDTIQLYQAVSSTTNSPGLYAFSGVGAAVPSVIATITKIR